MSSSLQAQVKNLKNELDIACQKLKINDLQSQLDALQLESSKSDFWAHSESAQATMRQISELQSKIGPWRELVEGVAELDGLLKLGDNSLTNELAEQYNKIQSTYIFMKKELAFSGPYDDHYVIMAIHAGAGGTDAQDWAQMLLRMYTRWAENEGAKVELIDESSGDEAGIKSATVEIGLPFAYGKLKGEHGVHRLVRLSPFNSDNLRQTSFAKVDVMPKIDRPEEVQIDDKDLKTDVYRAGGHGGQSVNTTDSAVRVTHIPTGITVSIQNERSQIQNKETAMTILRSRLAQLQIEQHQEHLTDIKGPNQSAEWGNQIRSYVLHPYKQVKDLRTRFESSDPAKVLDGDINPFIEAFVEHSIGQD